jgi:hypothetical protein
MAIEILGVIQVAFFRLIGDTSVADKPRRHADPDLQRAYVARDDGAGTNYSSISDCDPFQYFRPRTNPYIAADRDGTRDTFLTINSNGPSYDMVMICDKAAGRY